MIIHTILIDTLFVLLSIVRVLPNTWHIIPLYRTWYVIRRQQQTASTDMYDF